jgi:hypothetical protein
VMGYRFIFVLTFDIILTWRFLAMADQISRSTTSGTKPNRAVGVT